MTLKQVSTKWKIPIRELVKNLRPCWSHSKLNGNSKITGKMIVKVTKPYADGKYPEKQLGTRPIQFEMVSIEDECIRHVEDPDTGKLRPMTHYLCKWDPKQLQDGDDTTTWVCETKMDHGSRMVATWKNRKHKGQDHLVLLVDF